MTLINAIDHIPFINFGQSYFFVIDVQPRQFGLDEIIFFKFLFSNVIVNEKL